MMVAGEEAALALLAGAVSAVVLGGCSSSPSGAECGPEVHFLMYYGTRLRQNGSS